MFKAWALQSRKCFLAEKGGSLVSSLGEACVHVLHLLSADRAEAAHVQRLEAQNELIHKAQFRWKISYPFNL